MAGLVGGVVLPLLGAVPDGAIILFSGLGDNAQETLSVGVGALAGSTIMLLTIPFALSVYGGRVDLVGVNRDTPNYTSRPKLTPKETVADEWTLTGIAVTDAVRQGGWLMALTTIPYLMIQGPALFLKDVTTSDVAAHEHWWALAGFIVCIAGLCLYMKLQLQLSTEGQDRDKRMAVMKKMLKRGEMSLSGIAKSTIEGKMLTEPGTTEYQSLASAGSIHPSPAVASYLKELLTEPFYTYDHNGDGQLDKFETQVFFRDFHEAMSDEEMDALFVKYDADGSGTICLDEFIGLAYTLIQTKREESANGGLSQSQRPSSAMAETAFSEVEEEEVPEEFADLSPEAQQAAIKKRAFIMLFIGTLMVVVFSDPMVDVMQEIATRAHVSPFYVSFVLAPLASNASEVLASQYYASKKTRKTITVSLSALEGAANMNNTFCLSIFMGLIFFKGLAWQYTAETVAILITELIVAVLVQRNVMTTGLGLVIAALFPLSLVLVAVMEAFGFD